MFGFHTKAHRLTNRDKIWCVFTPGKVNVMVLLRTYVAFICQNLKK